MSFKTEHNDLTPSEHFQDMHSQHNFVDENQTPYQIIDGHWNCGLLLICDHAYNFIPEEYNNLGLTPNELSRHIAYDIGMAGLTYALAQEMNCPAVLSNFSRLLIDPNRGEDDPTVLMRLSDGALIPGNQHADDQEKSKRIVRFYRPYHDAIENAINRMIACGKPPLIFSLHSFTPFWRGQKRPWHVGVLWDQDARAAQPLIKELKTSADLCVGDNEPYTGALKNDTLYRHGTQRGLAHVLLEIRQDLVSEPKGIQEWARRLTPILKKLLQIPNIHIIQPSRNA